MTAGMNPRALSLRTAERPISARGSALSLTCFAIFFVLDVEQRRHRFVVVNPFDAFSEKLGNAEHGDLNPSTVRTGVLLVVTNSVISDFCNRRMATSTSTACATPA